MKDTFEYCQQSEKYISMRSLRELEKGGDPIADELDSMDDLQTLIELNSKRRPRG